MELCPFPIPAFVTVKLPPGKRQDGIRQPITIPLEDLPPETLNELLTEFVEAIEALERRAKAKRTKDTND